MQIAVHGTFPVSPMCCAVWKEIANARIGYVTVVVRYSVNAIHAISSLQRLPFRIDGLMIHENTDATAISERLFVSY